MVCTRVIAIRTDANVYDIGISASGKPPYLDAVVNINTANSEDINTIASSYLQNYQKSDSQTEIDFKDISVGMFNLIDISSLYRLTDSDIDITQYRLTSLDYTLSPARVDTKTSGVSPTVELWSESSRSAAGDQSSEHLQTRMINK